MKFKKLIETVKSPEIKRAGDAGYDLYLPEDIIIPAHSIATIRTGLAVEIPNKYCGITVPRSSIAINYPLIIQNALIDSNYRGEIHIIAYNPSDYVFKFKKDERIASLVVFKVSNTPKIEIVSELSSTNRGTNWNGSSGK